MPHNVSSPILYWLLYLSFLISGCQTGVQAPQPAVATNQDTARGIQLYRQNRIPEAVAALRQAVKRNKEDYEAWHFLGWALIKKHDLKNASKSFETALKLQPNFAASHTGLSYALLLRNKLPDAIREAQFALTIDPTISDAHYIIGVARLRAGAKQDALEQAEAVIKLSPQYGPAYLLKSQALVSFLGEALISQAHEPPEARKGRYREAADALDKYLQLSPNEEYKQTWIEQLDSLRFYAATPHKGDSESGAFSGTEVTTKARVLSKPEPTYTDDARQNGITGTVVLRCIFVADGTVKYFLVLSGLPYGLTEMAIRAARKIKFLPATIDGHPVSMFIQLEYNFNLY